MTEVVWSTPTVTEEGDQVKVAAWTTSAKAKNRIRQLVRVINFLIMV